MATNKKQRDWWKLFTLLVYFVAGMVIVFLLMRGLGLYQIAFAKFGLTRMVGVCNGFAIIPFLGGLLTGTCIPLLNFIVGLLPIGTLIVITGFQSITTVLYFNSAAIRGMVDQIRFNRSQVQRLDALKEDDEDTKTLIDRHNRIGEKTLKVLLIFSILAFALEGYIIWVARDGEGNLVDVLCDALALEVLITSVLVFRNAFMPKPKAAMYAGE